ncbi:MAG: hypothetical protein WA849_17170 [Candidatus Udaeobacter sp.]
MKRLLPIFELSKNEQRVVLIVMLVLITIALVGYERRVHHDPVRAPVAAEAKQSATPSGIEDER